MSGKEQAYVDVTKSTYPEEKTQAEDNGKHQGHELPPPAYADSPRTSSSAPAPAAKPLMTLSDNVRSDMRRLMEGDPNETIEVPMIHSTAKKSLRHLFVRDPGVVSHTVSVRKMKRDWYLKHYAKDAEGNYIGTEKPALDAPLVFVPSKSTPEDLLEQVHKVAFGKQHYVADFAGGWVATQAGGGAY